MEKVDSLLLASGGMDSTVMAYWLINKGVSFIPVFIKYRQHCEDTELQTLKKVLPKDIAEKIEIIDLSSVYVNSKSNLINEVNLWKVPITSDDLHIPYRNLLFLTAASAYAQSSGIKKVYSAFINSNHAKEIDCSYEFLNSVSGIIDSIGTVKIEMPFRNMSKTEVAKLGLEVRAPIELTYSCQASSRNHCGVCPNCVDRLTAMNSILESED